VAKGKHSIILCSAAVRVCVCVNTHTRHKNIRTDNHKLIQTVPNNICRSFQGWSLFDSFRSLVLKCNAVKCIGMRGHYEFASCCSSFDSDKH